MKHFHFTLKTISLLCAALLLFAGCNTLQAPQSAQLAPAERLVSTPSENEAVQAVLAQDSSLAAEHLVVDNKVYAIALHQAGAENQPLAVIVHGLGSRKEDMLTQGVMLAQQGFYAVLIDAPAHGESNEPAMNMMDIIVSMGASVDALVETLGDRADTESLYVTGFSMGGYFSFWYGAYGTYHPKAIAPCAGDPDWAPLVENGPGYSCVVHSQHTEPVWTHEEADLFAAAHNPMDNLDAFMDMGVYLYHGTEDDVQPCEKTERFYEALSAKGHPYLQFDKAEGVAHVYSDDLFARVTAFFAAYKEQSI